MTKADIERTLTTLQAIEGRLKAAWPTVEDNPVAYAQAGAELVELRDRVDNFRAQADRMSGKGMITGMFLRNELAGALRNLEDATAILCVEDQGVRDILFFTRVARGWLIRSLHLAEKL